MNTLRRGQRGLSLVELMVGITIGLFIVAAAALMLSTQLNENRRLLLETQIQQDLRASADIIARELRRAGYRGDAETDVWNSNPLLLAQPSNSPYVDLPVVAGAQGSVTYNYKRPDSASGPFRYWLDGGVIKTQLSSTASPQDLTDSKVLEVESMRIDVVSSTPTKLACPKACPLPLPPGLSDDHCWPTLAVRDLTVTITGHAVSDRAVRRSVQSRVRLRNDQLVFGAGDPAAPQACPA